ARQTGRAGPRARCGFYRVSRVEAATSLASSERLDAGDFPDLLIALDLARKEPVELLRRLRPGLGLLALEELLHLRRLQGLVDRGVELLEQRLRQPGRREHAPPELVFEAGRAL